MNYTVYVDDNFGYMDEERRSYLATFTTCNEAMTACKALVDDYLQQNYQPGMTAEELYQGYTQFGEDPFIQTADASCIFSAWAYAQERCRVIAGS